jgi:hypothetical protein
MKEAIRRAIAHVVYKNATGAHATSLLSHDTGKVTQMVSCSNTTFDTDEGAHLLHRSDGFYHYGFNTNVWVKLTGLTFKGNDQTSGQKFSGSVEGRWVRIHDLFEKKFFLYSALHVKNAAEETRPTLPGEPTVAPAPAGVALKAKPKIGGKLPAEGAAKRTSVKKNSARRGKAPG